MFAAEFDYHRPKTIDEAVRILHDVKGARVLAGGHSLLPAMKLRLASPAALVDIGRIRELNEIREANDVLRVGALVTHAAVASSDAVQRYAPVLAETARNIGDQQVRNRGTIGGSVAHADPGADYPAVMLLLGATFTAAGGNGQRRIRADEFFVDLLTTSLQPDELLTSIEIPRMSPQASAVYLKHRHPASAFAVVGVAALVEMKDGRCTDVRIAVGGARASAVRAKAAEQALTGHSPTEANIEQAAAAMADALPDPLSDSYASGEFRVHLATVMAKRALTQVTRKAR